jgi:hypothetical protein
MGPGVGVWATRLFRSSLAACQTRRVYPWPQVPRRATGLADADLAEK